MKIAPAETSTPAQTGTELAASTHLTDKDIEKVSRERLGSEVPEGKHPAVDWSARDNEDGSGGPVTADHILQNYGGGKGEVYRAWVPIGQVPEPKLAEENDAEEGEDPRSLYDWDSLGMTGDRRAVPPAKLMVMSTGRVVILDGNHRITYWKGRQYDCIPAWVIDRHREKP
jgi:hypothetical protein